MYYLGQYVGVGSRLPHDRADRTLALDLTERRLAALLPPAPRGYARGGSAVAVSQSGNGPEIVGRPSATPFFVFAFALPGAGVRLALGLVGDGEADAPPPKSHLKLKNPLSPRARFGGGGDMHEPCSREPQLQLQSPPQSPPPQHSP